MAGRTPQDYLLGTLIGFNYVLINDWFKVLHVYVLYVICQNCFINVGS